MAILKVARMGNPVLRVRADEVPMAEIKSPRIQKLIQDLKDTMEEYGGIGIAAPQVHESLRISIVRIPANSERYPDAEESPLQIFINPIVEVLDSTEQTFWEGCLSVPDMRGLVSRPRHIRITGLDETGAKVQIEAEDFLATVYQHEFDHLDGILYVDRAQPKTLSFQAEYDKYWAGTGLESLDD